MRKCEKRFERLPARDRADGEAETAEKCGEQNERFHGNCAGIWGDCRRGGCLPRLDLSRMGARPRPLRIEGLAVT